MTLKELNEFAEREGLPHTTEEQYAARSSVWDQAYASGRQYGFWHGFVLGLGFGGVLMAIQAAWLVMS